MRDRAPGKPTPTPRPHRETSESSALNLQAPTQQDLQGQWADTGDSHRLATL